MNIYNSTQLFCATVLHPNKDGAPMAYPRMGQLMGKISAFTEIQPMKQFDLVIS